MKKRISLFLTAAMLLSLFAAFAVTSVSADDARQPLKVTLVSGKSFLDGVELPSDATNLGKYFYGWTPIFDPSNTVTRVTPFMKANQTVEVIGKLEQPAVISSVVFNNVYKALRLNGVSLLFSVDGVNWVKGITLQETGEGKGDLEYTLPRDDTLYSYVKIFKSGNMADDTLGGVKGSYLDLFHVRFYSDSEKANDVIEATHADTLTTETSANLDKFFDFENRELCTVSGSVGPDMVVQGKFAQPTVITDVYLRYFGASANWTSVYASVDGEEWVRIAQMTGIWGNAANPASDVVAHMSVKDSIAYNYVKIERGHSYGTGWKSYAIGFLGTQSGAEGTPPDIHEPNTPDTPVNPPAIEDHAPVHLKGFQHGLGRDGRLAIRVVATVDSFQYVNIGMKLECTAPDGRTWSFDAPAKAQVRSITQTVNQVEHLILAEDLDGARIYTAVLAGIPGDVKQLHIKVTPYAVENGETIEGLPKALVIENGIAVPVEVD